MPEVDEANAERILAALWDVVARGGAVVVATHNAQALEYATRGAVARRPHRGGGALGDARPG